MATSFVNNNFMQLAFERKSIRLYDEETKITHSEMLEMIQEATTAPSSVNMQPWRFVVVDSEAGKKKLRPLVMSNLHQDDTSAAMLLIFGDMQCYRRGQEIYDLAVAEGKMSPETREKQLKTMIPTYQGFSKKQMNDVVKIDSSLAAMQFMLVARAHGYDTCAIGGFDAKHLPAAFDIDPERYVPVMIISIGKAAEKGHDTVRLKADSITRFV